MARYMLLIRGGGAAQAEYTPEQFQQMIQPYIDWSRKLREGGHYVAGEELASGGPVLRSAGGKVVVDGPYVETKETIGGFFIVQAASEAEAIDLAKGCPVLARGGVVELREIVEH